ncbi:MAG: DUF4160 domain-containing protein [Cyanobacteria bacterium P01_G01_bin.39]
MEENKDLMLEQKDIEELHERLHSIDLLNLLSEEGNVRHLELSVYKNNYTKLKIQQEKNHKLPHFHIEYKQEHSASYAIDSLERLAGDMPKEYEKPIMKWAKRKRNSLKATWDKLQAGEDVKELVIVSEKKSIF